MCVTNEGIRVILRGYTILVGRVFKHYEVIQQYDKTTQGESHEELYLGVLSIDVIWFNSFC